MIPSFQKSSNYKEGFLMFNRRRFCGFSFNVALGAMLIPLSGVMAAQTVLYNMGGPAGSVPYAGVVFDSSGDLDGTATAGGDFNDGTVFQLIPAGGGTWIEETRHMFGSNANDGKAPYGGLIFDASGNVYGTTSSGGLNGGGTVFMVTPTSGENWPETILWNFGATATDGTVPKCSLIFDASGNLWGTTSAGGASSAGTVFRLSPGASGWTETFLYSFVGGTDGSAPDAGVILDASGNVYGTTYSGGGYGGGTAFELIASQGWRKKILHSFGGFMDGGNPYGGLLMDGSGNLYGTTVNGGGVANDEHLGAGAAYELSPGEGPAWNETLIYEFCNHPVCTDINPYSALIMDSSGNLYGTDYGRGGFSDIFELTPNSTPPWTETILGTLSFYRSDSNDVAGRAYAGLTFDSSGNLYGTSSAGGQTLDLGTVYEVTH
jgi:uncharacterized repeat protein (TIGR03803 family)